MKICVAQTKPFKGDIQKNIESHKKLIDFAVLEDADIIVFPELSLTGYEPELAKSLATTQGDRVLGVFEQISNNSKITICVGLPTKSSFGIMISMIIFQPGKPRQSYSKQHLHPGEEVFFTNGKNPVLLTIDNSKIGLAICYEVSVPEHSENAFSNGANIYIASVLNSVSGVDKDIKRLSDIAGKYKMTVLMSNYVGRSGGYECAGKSSIWNNQGILVAQLNNKDEGIIIMDIETQKIIEKVI